jgi:hypothetical protein
MLFRRQVIVVERSEQLARFMQRLDVLCRNTAAHPLPVKMKFIAEAMSDSRQPMAVYACPFEGCPCRQGWVRERHSGRPFRLWSGMHPKGNSRVGTA